MISINKHKVSVIVPIYKVEKYIHRCIDTILNQTYVNLEVILVNDGSPDNGGAIAEAYKAKDNRVKVIHKTNGGLSDARNAGMQHVTGHFTMFVDSDDWLDIKMIETMVEKSNIYEADIVQSAFYYAFDDALYIDDRYVEQNDHPFILNNNQLMYELVKNELVKNFAWGKLYKTKMIHNIPFKKGVLFEDVFWTHQVMHKVNNYCILHEPYYYYYQRDDSIVASYSPRNLDIIKGLKERHRFIKKYYPALTNESYELILKTCFIHYYLLLINRKQDKRGNYRRDVKQYIHNHYTTFNEVVFYNRLLRRQLLLFNIHPSFYLLYRGLIKGLRKVKVLSQPVGLKKVKIIDENKTVDCTHIGLYF